MKKILGAILVFLFILIFNKTIISQILIFSASKMTERNISIESINIDYSKNQIILNAVEVGNVNKLYHKNIFEAEKIMIQYNLRSLFSDLVTIDYLIFINSKLFLEFDINTNTNIIVNDNLEEVKKLDDSYKPKIYPIKKKDINFLILKLQTYNTQGFIKTSNKIDEIKINLSNVNFNKVGNKTGFQHYKEVFKIILVDVFLKVPGSALKNLIKKTYKLQY